MRIEKDMSKDTQSKAYENVLHFIKQKILNGELQRGDKLPPERELAETLGVGRNSVREALRILEIMGVITSEQGAGNYISCNFRKNMIESMTMMFLLDELNYQQISELREAIELKAADLAAERITDAQIAELEQILRELETCSDELRCAAMDKRLHYIIAEASQNVLIFQILNVLSDVIDIFICNMRGKIITGGGNREPLQQVHERLVDGLGRRNKKQVHAAMKEHFRLINETIAEAEKENIIRKNIL